MAADTVISDTVAIFFLQDQMLPTFEQIAFVNQDSIVKSKKQIMVYRKYRTNSIISKDYNIPMYRTQEESTKIHCLTIFRWV